MVEIKSVKVDNWGVFFLQKLQNFFNKTDYCDLTLQFQDNSQLKVHRLVLSACTDYFNLLEQQCEMIEDILIMPRDLQADVVVPIVNFMYTGTLEFEVNMYGRLLKTAKDMNMTVLLKLLEAHKRTVEPAAKPNAQPVLLNKSANQRMNTYGRSQPHHSGTKSTPQADKPQQQRTYAPRRTAPGTSQSTAATSSTAGSGIITKQLSRTPVTATYIKRNLPEPVQLVTRYANTPGSGTKGPSRFDCSEDVILPDHFENSFDNISYESKPLMTARQVIKEEKDTDEDGPSTSSNFEQLRKGYSNKRHLSPVYIQSPPEKKPNLQDIIEFTAAERERKEIVAEEYEGTEYIEENFSNDEDEQYIPQSKGGKSKEDKPMIIKSESGDMNHTKIIQEVLKKYPHLVKNNKNIKLKIMQKGNTTQTHVVPVKTSPSSSSSTSSTKPQAIIKAAVASTSSAAATTSSSPSSSTALKAATSSSSSAKAPATGTAASTSTGPKKIDSKTMHALIAKGAENMTGPWLCLKCGHNGRPISIPSYRSFRRHLISVHREKIDAKLCEHCGWRSQSKAALYYHIFVKHNIKPPSEYKFPKCVECDHIAVDSAALAKHRDDQHAKAKLNAHHCIYCNKTFSNEILLYAHMRNNHKERACEDGVMDFDEDDAMELEEDVYTPNSSTAGAATSENKIKIISDIALPAKRISYVLDAGTHTVSSIGGSIVTQSPISLEPSSEAEGLNTVASGIATSLAVLDSDMVISHPDDFHATTHRSGSNTIISSQLIESAMADVHGEKEEDPQHARFVTEEGSSLDLTPSQRAVLLQQLQDQSSVVMILNEDRFEEDQQVINQSDDQNIVVVYSQTDESNNTKAITESTKSSAPNTSDNVEETQNTEGNGGDEGADNENDDGAGHDDGVDDDDDDDDNVSPEEMLIKIEKADEETASKITDDSGPTLSTKNLISALEGDWSDDEHAQEKIASKDSAKKANDSAKSKSNIDKHRAGSTSSVDSSKSSSKSKDKEVKEKEKEIEHKKKEKEQNVSEKSDSRRNSRSESVDSKKHRSLDKSKESTSGSNSNIGSSSSGSRSSSSGNKSNVVQKKSQEKKVEKKEIVEEKTIDNTDEKDDDQDEDPEEGHEREDDDDNDDDTKEKEAIEEALEEENKGKSSKCVDDGKAKERKSSSSVTTTTTEKKGTKSDLKNLINDWGDDGEDIDDE